MFVSVILLLIYHDLTKPKITYIIDRPQKARGDLPKPAFRRMYF